MQPDKPKAPGWRPNAAEPHSHSPDQLEFAPPGEVDWTAESSAPEQWRPSDCEESPTRTGSHTQQAPEQAPIPSDREKDQG